MASQKRMRTQSSAALEPDNHKKRELEHDSLDIAKGGTAYDQDDPETKPMPAKDRDKLGVTVGSAIYCSFEIKPLYPSFFRHEIVFAPPPEEASNHPKRSTASPSPAPPLRARHSQNIDRLYICETCFKYTPHESAYSAHVDGRCLNIHAPPGQIIYLSPGMPYHPQKATMPDPDPSALPGHRQPELRKTTGYALYEIDGDEHKLFCQNLSLFAKLWVESKSVGFDVGGFMFYVLVQMTAPKPSDITPHKFKKEKQRADRGSTARSAKNTDLDSPEQRALDDGSELDDQEEDPDIPNRIVGYFSKEKNSWDHNNLACILVFPPWQSMGIGQLLIEASYVLGEREGRYGGPERPLSDSGRKSYESYWNRAVAESLLRKSSLGEPVPTIQDVATDAWIVPEDVIATLKRVEWAEGLLSDDAKEGEEKTQKLVINRQKVGDWLAAKPHRAGLEHDGWLFDDQSGEENSSSEDEDEDEDEEDDEEEDISDASESPEDDDDG